MKRVLGIVAALALGALGAQLVGARAASAQAPSSQFKECFAVSLYAVSGRELSAGALPDKMVKVPAGWTPVGGTVTGSGSATQPGMVLCR